MRRDTQPVSACPEPVFESISRTQNPGPRQGWDSDFIDEMTFYTLPSDALHDGDNVIEIMPPQVDGELVWVEILLLP